MDIIKYISVLFMVFGGGDTGGHGGSHHDHVKLHVPEFIHHDHHTKVITIHHHHHKPKEKHHHHHHHHHPKPHIPYGHHYHKQHKKSHTKLHTTTTSHGKNHNSHHGKPGHHSKYGHHGGHSHHASHTPKHHDPPSFNYDPNPVTFEDDFKSFTPAVQATIPQIPQVYGVQHTVKQVKVFDSLPGALPTNTGSHGYEVTEEGEQSEDDALTAINTLPQTYPATFGYVRNVGIDPAQNDVLSDYPVQSSLQASSDPYASGYQPASYANIETFSTGHDDSFSALAPSQGISPSVSSSSFQEDVPATGFDEANVYTGDITGTALLSTDEDLSDDTPVSFAREAGIQETINTGDVQTVVY